MTAFGWKRKMILGALAISLSVALSSLEPSINAESKIMPREKMEKKNKLPKDFVYLDESIPTAQYDIRYYEAVR